MLRKWSLLGFTLLAAAFLAFTGATPPAPQGPQTPADQFSSARAMVDVRRIAAAPHPTGSAENAKVRAYLAQRMTDLGLEVQTSESRLGERALARLNKWSGETKTEQAIFNVIGVLPGRDRAKPALMLMAHHDTVWGSPGATDDTIGIAAILEIIRALNESGPPERNLIVVFTDGEELGLSGAVNFFKDNPLAEIVGAVINFEARGGGGTAGMFQTSADNGDAARLFARAVKDPSTSSLSTFVYSVLPNDTDLTPALEKDYTAYNIANIGNAEYYHSPKIDANALSESTLQHMGSQGLDLTRALQSAKTLPEKKPDAVFFDLFGLFTVIYAPFWGWVFLVIAAAFYGLSVKDAFRPKDIMLGSARMLGFVIIGGLLLFVLNWLSGSGSGSNYYDRLAAIHKIEVLALFFGIAMFFAAFGGKDHDENSQLGAALPLFVLAAAGQVLAPTAAYFLTLPLMLCAAASWASQRWPDRMLASLIVVLLAVPVIGYMLSLEHLLILGVGPDLLSVTIFPAAVASLALLPLYAGLPKTACRALAVMGLLASLGIALWIRFDPIAVTVPLY